MLRCENVSFREGMQEMWHGGLGRGESIHKQQGVFITDDIWMAPSPTKKNNLVFPSSNDLCVCICTCVYIYINKYLEPISHLFSLQKRVFSNQNKGHLGSRIYIYIINKWQMEKLQPVAHVFQGLGWKTVIRKRHHPVEQNRWVEDRPHFSYYIHTLSRLAYIWGVYAKTWGHTSAKHFFLRDTFLNFTVPVQTNCASVIVNT